MILLPNILNVRWFASAIHAAGLLVAVLIIASSMLAFDAMENRRAQLESETANSQDVLRSKAKVHDSLAAVTRKVQALEADVSQMREEFPKNPDETGFLASISGLAAQANVSINNFRAGSIRSLPTHKVLEVSFRGEGDYSGVCQFLAQLHQLPRRVHITQLNLMAPMTREQSYSIDVELRLGFALTPNSIPSDATP